MADFENEFDIFALNKCATFKMASAWMMLCLELRIVN